MPQSIAHAFRMILGNIQNIILYAETLLVRRWSVQYRRVVYLLGKHPIHLPGLHDVLERITRAVCVTGIKPTINVFLLVELCIATVGQRGIPK
jgi:hypothetical protein